MSDWVEITLRLPQEEYVHPHLVRDDVADTLANVGYEGFTATVTDTSPGYGRAAVGGGVTTDA